MKKVPRNTPNENLEASRFWGSQKVSAPDAFFRPFGAAWAILADLWDPSKSGWAPKTAQKIQYGYFLVPLGDQRAEKIGFGRRLERTGKFDQKSRRKWEAAKVENH